MKRVTLLALAAVLILTLFACAPNSHLEAANTDNSPSVFEAASMPTPFQNEGGDDNTGFNQPHVFRLSLGGFIFEDVANYLGFTVDELHTSLDERFGDWQSEMSRTSLLGRNNLFSLVVEYEIPNEVVAESIRKTNEFYEELAIQFNDNGYRELYQFTDAEIDAFLSRDETKALGAFATEYAIVIEDKVYTPMWLYLHSPEEYTREGITPEMVEEKLDSYGDFYLTEDAISAFEDKLSVFTGESVTLDCIEAD